MTFCWGPGGFTADNGTATISGFTVSILSGTNTNFILLYTLGPNATTGKSFRARIASAADIKAREAASQAAVAVTGSAVVGFLRTVGHGTLTFVKLKQTPDGAVAIPNRQLLPLINLQVHADDIEDVVINSINFSDIGTAHAVTGILPGSVRLFAFSEKITSPPTKASDALTSSTFQADNGIVTLTPTNRLVIPRGSSLRLWVTIDVVDANTGVIGSKYQIKFPSTNPLQAVGVFSTDPPSLFGTGTDTQPTSGPLWEFNYNPLVFSMPNDLGAVHMPATAQKYPVFAFQVKNDPDARSEKVTISEFTFHAEGTMNDPAAVTEVQLYRDISPYGKIDAKDILLGSGVFNVDDGIATISFTDQPVTLGLGGFENFVLAYNLSGQAIDGQTASVSLLSRNDMMAIGEVSQVNGSMIPFPVLGAVKTIGQPQAEFNLETNRAYIPNVVAPEAKDFPLLGFRIKNGKDEILLLKGLHLKLIGPKDERQYFTKFDLWSDVNGNGVHDVGDLKIGTAGPPTSVGKDSVIDLTIVDGSEFKIDQSVAKRFTLHADIAQSVLGDGSETFDIVAEADKDIVALGATSGAQASFTTANPPFTESRTIRNPVVEIANYIKSGGQDWQGCINGSYGMIGSKLTVPSGEDLKITKARFTVAGTLDDAAHVKWGYVWGDVNRNFMYDSSDNPDPFSIHYQLWPIPHDNGEGLIDLTAKPGMVKKNSTTNLTVGLGFYAPIQTDAIAQLGKTCTAFQIGNLVFEGVGVLSGRAIEFINPPGNDEGLTLTFDAGWLNVSQGKVDRTAGPPNGNNIETMSLYLQTSILEEVWINQLILKPLGTINESRDIKPGGIKIYLDMNRNGKVDTGDVLIGVADPPASDNGSIVIKQANYDLSGTGNCQNFVYSHPYGGTPYDIFLITVDLAANAPEGKTIQFSLQSIPDLTATGMLSLVPYKAGGIANSTGSINYPGGPPPLIGPSILVQRGAVSLQTNTTFAKNVDNQPTVVMAPSAKKYEVLQLDAKATPSEDVELTGLTIRSTGTAGELKDLAILGVELYKGPVLTANFLTSGTFTMDNGAVALTNFRQPITLNSKIATDLRVAFTGSGVGMMGKDFNLKISGVDLIAKGISSGLAITSIVPANPYAAIPIRFGAGRIYIRATEDNGYILPIPTGTIPRIQKLRFAASRVEGVRLDEIDVRGMGTANEITALQNAALLLNSWNGTTPTRVNSSSFVPGDNGLASLKNLNIQVDPSKNTSDRYSLDVALNPANTLTSTTLRMDLESTITCVRAVGLTTGSPVDVVFEDLAGGENLMHESKITGRFVTLSTGLVTLKNGDKPPKNAIVRGNELNLPLMQILVEVKKGLEAVTISEVDIQGAGPVKTGISAISLYQDVDKDGKATAADLLIGKTTFNADNGTARFSNLKLTYAEDTALRWLLVADLNCANYKNKTIQLKVGAKGSVIGTGQLTKMPLSLVIGLPAPAGALYTINPVPKTSALDWEIYE